MIAPATSSPFTESLRSPSPFDVSEAEYRRLLGYPPGHEPGERARELAAQARRWYGAHGKPWRYFREATLRYTGDVVLIGGAAFRSPGLLRRLRDAEADRVLLAVASAGASCEEHARALWQEGKPDEYFFLEMFGSAVVEALIAGLHGDICSLAARDGRWALPHYSPGYAEWDVADQPALFRVLQAGLAEPLPEPMQVMTSGMLVPRKALLAIIGLTPQEPAVAPGIVPCMECTFSPCAYRRAPNRHTPSVPASAPAASAPPAAPASYRLNPRALRKWATERVWLQREENGEIRARFRFDGTTCSNEGLAFDYEIDLAPTGDRYVIRRAACHPSSDDEGYRKTCAYIADSDELIRALATEGPRPGLTLGEAMETAEAGLPSGCHCTADGRAHKWSMALQAIHFALHSSP